MTQQVMVQPVPQRNMLMWLLFGIVTMGFGLLIYYIISLSDLKKFSDDVFQRTNRSISVPPGILFIIPLVNLFVLIQRQDKLNALLDASGIQIQDRVLSGILLILSMFIPFVNFIVIFWQLFKWQGIMNQVSAIQMSS